jgi:hypothetical protein
MSTVSFVSPQRELELVQYLISQTTGVDEIVRDLILSGYSTEKGMLELLIRTSCNKHALIVKLLKIGIDTEKLLISVDENNKVQLTVSRKNKSNLTVIESLRSN